MGRTEFLVFRHGETDWNRERRLQGHTDVSLNELGRIQAEGIGPVLAKHRPEAMLTSDLTRARETAAIVNRGLGLPLHVSEALRERGLGAVEGMQREQLIAELGSATLRKLVSLNPEDQHFQFPGGESKAAHASRVVGFLERFVRENPQYKTIAVSTHGGSVHNIVHHCEGAPSDPVPLPNGVVYRVAFDHDSGRWEFLGPASDLMAAAGATQGTGSGNLV